MAANKTNLLLLFTIMVVDVLCLSGIQLVDSSKVTSITPRQGSLAGATRITISGQGFSEDPFNYGAGNEANGNQVFLKNQFTTVVCSVIPYYCNEEKIVCDTRSIGKEGSFDVFVIVDGEPVTDYCTKKTDCEFQFKKSNTPTIKKITPSSGIAGTKLSTRGKIITDIYDPSQNLDPEESEGRNQILRVYWGNYACDPFDPASGKLYTIALDSLGSSNGVIECVPKGTFIASQMVSYLVSNNYGRSWSERDALLVSGQNKLYHFQAHADVLGVYPDVGSTEGGTTLNITGQYFDEQDSKVLVGGIPCEISSITTTQILCVTGPAPTSRAVYPGERGLLYEVWTDTAVSLDDAVWDTTAPDYNFTLVPDASSPSEHRLGEEDNFISRLSGFFVPPRTGHYQFKIRSDDDSRLYLSLSSDDPNNKTLIASVDTFSDSWDSYPSQASETFNLVGNQSYYMEALLRELSGLDFIEVGVVLFDVPLSNVDISAAQNEVQQIKTFSVVIKESQTLTIEGATYEVQEVSIMRSSCPEGDCSYKLQLGENVTLTGDISVTATAAEMESNLNLLLNPDTVRVTVETSSVKTVYAVEFLILKEDIPLLRVVKDDPDLVITISQRTAFLPIELNSFRIVSDGITSATLSSSSSAKEVQNALLELFSVKCTSVGQVIGYYVQDFEGDIEGYVDGNVVQDEEPFCGRSSLKNPQIIFYAGKTLKPGTAMTVKAFDVRYNGQLCVGHRGSLLPKLQMYYHWVDSSNNDRYDWQTFNDVPFEFGSEDWRFSCIDIGTLSTTQGWIYQHHKNGYPLLIERIKLAGEEGDNFFVDNLYIGSQTPQYIRVQRPARPNGIFVSDAKVQQHGYSFDITLTSAKCGFNYPLLGIKDADLTMNETDRAVYVNTTTWPAGVRISIVREARATPPISGTFDLRLYGSVIQVPSQATAAKLKELLQSNLEIGALDVGRQGTCAGYSWRVEWTSKGGSQPLIEVDGARLIGNEVDILSKRLRKGQLFMAPIPGEFLRTPHEEPQVEVIVNTIPSSCSEGQCNFEFNLDATPGISAVSPTSGAVNTTLTLTGTGFSTVPEDNIVTIGGIQCDIMASSETSLTALVKEVPTGLYSVNLTVTGKGLARYPNGVVTFQSELEVSSIDPESGSTAGGTTVTISGHGFSQDGENTTVFVGTQACLIESVTYRQIQCVIALKIGTFSRYRRTMTSVDVSIHVNGESKVLDNGYNYDAAQTPSIIEISPTTSNVKGGGDLLILGSGFGESGAVVSIGSTNCRVKSQSDVEITATIPDHTAGNFHVELTVTDKGFAEFNNNTFKYELEVTGMFPDHGSIQGGTVVTLTGAGFGSNASDVTVRLDDVNCEVTAVDNDEIDCVVTSSEKAHRVDNFGKHESLGLGYKWNPSLLSIVAGDVVVWQWAVPQYVTGIGYAVMQTADADSVLYDGQGFISGGRTTEGIFAYKFAHPGTYYYSSGPVDDDDQVYMKGTIVVKEPTSSAHKLVVEVAGFEALHDTTSGVSAPVSSDPCPGDDSPIPGCNTPKASGEDPANFFFSFWICSTPVVQQISPNEGVPTTLVRILGNGFSEDPCENKISIGDYNCITENSTDTALTCLIDTADSMRVGERHQVSVAVKNRGLALSQITSPKKQVFILKPQIDGLSTHEGSLRGGTEIIISGDGFSAESPDDVEVRIGETGCLVQTVSYKEVVCITAAAVAGIVELTIQINSQQAVCMTDCSFMFSEAMTPQVSGVSPATVSGPNTSVVIIGSGFTDDAPVVTVSIGGVGCAISSFTDLEIQCLVSYVPVGTQQISVHIAGKGNAHFNAASTVTSSNAIESISPSVGSTAGGQMLTIVGNGFVGGATAVEIDGRSCEVENVTLSQIRCKTKEHAEGTFGLIVTSNGVVYPTESYQYSIAATPVVTTVTPIEGKPGDQITVVGSSFSTEPSDVTVTIDGTQCAISSVTMDTIVCSVGPHSAGRYGVVVHIQEKGLSADDTQFEYELTVTEVSPSDGSFGGGKTMNITGSGFDSTVLVTLCDNVCPVISVDSSTIQCDVPSNSGSGDDQVCDVTIALSSGATVTEPDSFTYKTSLTPVIDSVEPRRGGTAGGTNLTITGSGFQATGNLVTIGGAVCSVMEESESEIVCMTAAHRPSEMTKVRVEVGSNGIATQDNADFYYIDVWSSKYTWGYEDPPIEGDFVTIPAGQTLLLDVSTPILKMLLIQGGTLLFDEADIELHAENILIVDGGALQVGTEEEPFQHQATIMMHGHVRSQELPLFGAKTLAVRNGTLDLHGLPTPITWTRLAQTAGEGATQITLEQAVTWKVGDQVVIATTGHRHSQYENEELTITGVSPDGSVLTFSPPLKYKHVGITQTIEGVTLDMRAEVGLLTRNVKVRGSVQEDWIEEYEACPEEFDTDQFASQTCFLGKFGEETGSDQFGSQIMLFPKYKGQQLVKGRIEYVEVTHAGQAFRLGRYPIHFHLCGNMSGSYVRGCGIHETFNRALTMHGTHNLLVEHNVAYNIMGHAYFLEDGIEIGNIIQYNLGVFVRPSSSLLNVDITPATYWVTNPDNIVRHNAAAGGSHFGFWYNMPSHPEGPSATTAICPRSVPLREFHNNTAHAMGWYGLWVFPTYHPKVGGACGSRQDEPAKFHSLFAWETERGAEAVNVGAVQFHDFVISDVDEAGVEYQMVTAHQWGAEGALIKNLIVIAYSEISEDEKELVCTVEGIKGPQNDGLTVDGAKLINFDQDRCAGIGYCSKCRPNQGGFSVHLRDLEFLNSPNKAAFQWEHECWLEDLDGTLTGTANQIVLPTNPNLPPDHCIQNASYSVGVVPGSLCDDTVRLHRLAFNQPSPPSLLYKDALFTNAHGTSRVPYRDMRLTHSKGWMVTLIDSDNYNFIFEDVDHVTNISYDARFYSFKDGDFLLMNHNFTQTPDRFAINGEVKNSSEQRLTYDSNYNGDLHFENETQTLTYLVSGKGEASSVDRDVSLNVYSCFYQDCIKPVPKPPPEGRPEEFRIWSDQESWDSSAVPVDGEDVMILPTVWMVADVPLPVMNKLFIYGTLEIEDTRDNKLEATYILIQGGRLVIGFSESRPFEHDIKILLNGNHFTPEQPLPNGPNLGSKALGVFGGLDLHGKSRSVYWTQLSATVSPGEDVLSVVAMTDWIVGDEIVVATTSYKAWQTETFTIVEVKDPSTFRINGTFAFKHIALVAADYVLAAEVGLLTRNIKIEGNDYDRLFDESFGARVLVSRMFTDGTEYKGYARISNVQFFHTGQEGYTAAYDPRYSLVYLDVGEVTDLSPSYVKGCSFHNGFSPAIGVYGSTEGLLIQDNVAHHTVGPGLIVQGEYNRLVHNLVTLVIFPGTYQDRAEKENLIWNAGIEVESASKVVLINNTVAGSERVAFKIRGEACFEAGNPLTDWYGNVGHSTLHGIHMHLISQDGCSKVANFLIYKSWDFGIYHQVESSILMTGMTFVDNKVAVLPLVYGPSALSHETSDKFVRLERSLLVGVSEAFDCVADDVEPENAWQSSGQRGFHPPGKGHVGVTWATFGSGPNLAPLFAFQRGDTYPAINGITELKNVVFRSFGRHCGKTDVAIMANPASEDSQHPMVTSRIQLEDVDAARRIFIARPRVSSVNPSDCVDMDCDGLKKAMLHDLDGTLLGSVGTVIPQSEYEWDGDPRRGLGDYRIPKALLTGPDGTKIPVEDKAPNKGIYRGNNNECVWKADWQAYECHGIDHMMLILESMDADTEVRRLSPLAMYSDGYVDLINGPKDNGWCNGYTCQERISTFNALIATGKEYEVYFTSTNPQNLRFHLLNSKEDQAVLLGVFYTKPERLDVYYEELYVTPNNADFSTGELIWAPKDPNLPTDQYKPSLTSGVHGENYFDRDTQTLWILIKGPVPIDIRTVPIIELSLGVPGVAIDDFYEQENLIANLADLLNVDPSQIRVVNVVSEANGRRRRRAAEGEAEIIFEIGPQPALSIESPGSEGATTEAPITTPSSKAGISLDYDDLVAAQSILADARQLGSLSKSLNITIRSMAMTEPSPTVVDPTGGMRATNETGGSDDVPEGTKTYDEIMREEEEKKNAENPSEVVYLTPSHLVIHTQPGEAVEAAPFSQQPALYAVDTSGRIIPQLGHRLNPWQLTATINPSTPDVNIAGLTGNLTIAFDGSWANFTDLAVSISTSGVLLDFTITHPNTSSLPVVTSEAFDVAERPYYLSPLTSPDVVHEMDSFEVVVELRDEITHEVPYNLTRQGYEWNAKVAISMPSNYKGQLLGQTEATFNLDTAQARLSNLSIDATGVKYRLTVSVTTVPASHYQLSLLLAPFDVEACLPGNYTGPTRKVLLRFLSDFDQVAAGKEELLAINFLNHIDPKYPAVKMSNVVIARGSILISFDMQGNVDTTQEVMWSDIQGGRFSLEFDGYTLIADEYMKVDDIEYGPKEVGHRGLPDWAIALIVILVLAMMCGIGTVVYKISSTRGKQVTDTGEELLNDEQVFHLRDFSRSATPSGMEGGVSDKMPFLTAEPSNSPRRTPEIAVTSLPPGFTEATGQVEQLRDDRVKMLVMVRNQDGSLQKLSTVQGNKVGTIRALRKDVKRALPAKLHDKKFILLDEGLRDISGAKEKKLTTSEVYHSECVMIRWLQDSDLSKLCVCGLVGQFECSLCHHQAYCSPQCQACDWIRHSTQCTNDSKV